MVLTTVADHEIAEGIALPKGRIQRSDHCSIRDFRQVAVGVLCLLVSLFSYESAVAQTRLPGPAEPGRIQPPFEQPEPPTLRPKTDVTPARRPNNPPEGAEDIRFVLRGLSITGVTVYAQDEFHALIEPKIGQEITLADLYGVADAITSPYGSDGYILSQALVPAQRIEMVSPASMSWKTRSTRSRSTARPQKTPTTCAGSQRISARRSR